MQSSISRRSLLNYAGIAILLAGLCCGEFIYWRGGNAHADDSVARLADSKAYDRAMQSQAGTFGMLTAQWDRGLAKLGEPGPLAAAICAASAIGAGCCFFAASRMPRG